MTAFGQKRPFAVARERATFAIALNILRSASSSVAAWSGIGFFGLGAVMGKLKSERVLTPEQLQAIGSVAVQATYLEMDMEQFIWRLLEISDEDGKLLTDSMRLMGRIGLMGDIGKLRIKDVKRKAEYTSLIGDLKIVADERNTIIHGLWESYTSLHAKSFAMARKRRRKSPPLEFLPSNILKTAHRKNELHDWFNHFFLKEWQIAWI